MTSGPATLLYVSYPRALDADVEEVLLRVRSSPSLRVRRAQNMDEVLADIENELRHGPYTRLDLVGHANDDGMDLGDFSVADAGLASSFLVKLQDVLKSRPELEVRFLGCGTADGPRWLQSASATLGGRPCWTTTDAIDQHHFSDTGFAADNMLISSQAVAQRTQRKPS